MVSNMKMRKTKRGCRAIGAAISTALLALALCFCAILGLYDFLIPETVSCFTSEAYPSYLGATLESNGSVEGDIISVGTGQYKLFSAIPVKQVATAQLKDLKVHVGGFPFGIKFFTKGALVVGFDDEGTNPAFVAGLRLYDIITQINGKEISGTNKINEIIENCGGKAVSLTFLRAGKEMKISFVPEFSDSEARYKAGIWLKDSGAGIGTVTYILDDGSFGGLGHGVCDGDTGELVKIESGSVVGVTLNGVVKGERGAPGELKGYFNSTRSGVLLKNTDCGIFGCFANAPVASLGAAVPIGLKSDLKAGKASIFCTLDDNERREYEVEIFDINVNASGNKCFSIRITDGELLKKTGGIVQGMSGSPIIQDGKLVGAVTHVLINDPSRGYGIFIENMIAAANAPMAKAS